MIRTGTTLLLLWVIATISAADSFPHFEQTTRSLQALQDAGEYTRPEISKVLRGKTEEFAIYAVRKQLYAFVEERRIDKQIGASAGTSSTTLVSKGSVPAVFGLAVESGALYQSVSGSIVTFRLNPVGLVRALVNQRYVVSDASGDQLLYGLSRLSGSASFNFQKGSSPGTFTGEPSQLEEITARLDLINERDPRHPSNAESIRELAMSMNSRITAVHDFYKTITGQDCNLTEAPNSDPCMRKMVYEEWLAGATSKLFETKI